MNLFPVYKTYNVRLTRGDGCYVFDDRGNSYLDLYGGHAVISVGHSHPKYVEALTEQLGNLAYYSNSVELPIQKKLAKKLGKASGCENYQLFLCNSGAEAVENAIKLASFHTGRKKIIAFTGSFHGRTHGALAVTDNLNIRAAVNKADHVIRVPFNDEEALKQTFLDHQGQVAAVIIEPIQGVGGIQLASTSFLMLIERLCLQDDALFIADEVQSGFGRSGKFFSYQYADVHPHLITVAKGMGNGFPVGGVLIHDEIKSVFGMLGTTFGGNPMACAAAIAVLDIMKEEKLIQNSRDLGQYFMKKLKGLPGVKEVRGIGLMIGVEFEFPVAGMRRALLMDHHIFTGSAKQSDVLRFLPPLNVNKKQINHALKCMKQLLQNL